MKESQYCEPEGKVTTQDAASGWTAFLHHGDGTATSFWARAEREAYSKATDRRDDPDE